MDSHYYAVLVQQGSSPSVVPIRVCSKKLFHFCQVVAGVEDIEKPIFYFPFADLFGAMRAVGPNGQAFRQDMQFTTGVWGEPHIIRLRPGLPRRVLSEVDVNTTSGGVHKHEVGMEQQS